MQIIPVSEGPLPTATTDREQVKADVTKHGYGILKDALSPEQVRLMRSVLSREIEKEEKAGNIKESYTDRDATNRRLAILMDRHECFRDLVEDPMAMEMAQFILGPSYLNEPFLLHALSANVTRPGSRDMGIHGDTDYILPHYDAPLFARVIWFLDDFDEEVGATRVVPGSHRLGHLPIKDGSVRYESVAAEGPAGSALIYDGRLYHGTGANRSKDRERAGVIAGYIHPWMRPMGFFPLLLDPEMMKGASERCRQLLGYSTVNIGFDQPWKYAPAEIDALRVSHARPLEEMRHQVRQDETA
ncbi:phytanoyl-CoA dioxygenase family protein [Novosphingobium naphthalenivorans]|uniref:phytanoyl-CoA dioxygenase family protein n=1 Tax=Novosphingobium naphthalenivorans TaxID=273168 RepID=UPI00082CC79D|nr:phytanoyl-CoA dioxygenase family protein [Novosphingobium naphthalenivorans]